MYGSLTHMSNLTLIGSRDAATVLGVSRSALNRDVLAGKIPVTAKLSSRNGAWLFDRAEIERMAKESSK